MNFWETKKLADMNLQEWESLCDGCGRCCLNKLEDEDTGTIYFTNAACKLLDLTSCRCSRYETRLQWVPECMDLKGSNLQKALNWLPSTCAYRLLAEGKELFDWHPLISGNAESVFTAGISIRDYAVSETEVDEADLEDHIIEDFD
jgi:hypothetical protein